ncbi:MAG: hypothetical protein F6K47_27570 [Symploca sp. SIO2E6]|nr:hypothetical protein [Symploca sp. SIO2E6]
MPENSLKISISLEALEEAILSLGIAEKQRLLELLEAELFWSTEDSPEDITEVNAASADYIEGDYITLDQYKAQG